MSPRSVPLCLSLLVCACAHPPDRAPASSGDSSDASSMAVADGEDPEAAARAQFQATSTAVLGEYLDHYPLRGVVLGHHEYDGRVRDCSAAGLKTELEFLRTRIAALEATDATLLDSRARVERTALISTLDGERFELEVRRAPWTNPMFYMADLELTAYIARDYAPIEQRVDAVIAAAKAGVVHLGHAAANLEPMLARPFVDTALLQVRGTISFVEADVPAALAKLEDPAKAEALAAALSGLSEALRGYEALLVERQKTATDSFALGAERYLEMLARTQGIEVDLPTLQRIAEADLARNLAALDEAAKRIDPKKTTAQVMAMVGKDRPKPAEVLAVATEQAATLRRVLIDQSVVTIPSEDVAVVTETPSFMRWNSAFLDGAGPFETSPLPSFYYISPPDPSWTKAQQREYIPSTVDLLFITVHEVWPGHFLHGLHVKANESEVLKSLWNFTTGEGWAHYTEQMMVEFVGTDPRTEVGQLQNALLRNVRFVVALGLHTGTMTVDEATVLFETKAFQDPINARQQAMRGTFDPMYLGYTLGKLAILQLRDDWMAKQKAEGGDDSLQFFHDQLLGYAAAPLPAIREAMLGPDAGPLLR